MAIMVTSFRSSLDAWLEHILPADLYFRTAASDAAQLAPADQARVAALPGVARVEFSREEQLLLDPARPRLVLLARPVTEADAPSMLALVAAPSTRPPGAPPPAWVNEAAADLYDFTPGRTIVLPLAGRDVRVLRRRRLPRLQPAAGRGADRARHVHRADRRPRGDQRGDPRRAGRVGRSSARDDRARAARRRPARDRAARRDPRAVAESVRPHVRRHLCAGDRRGRDRPDRPVVVVRRAGARAAARVRRAAPRRHDAPADRLDARHRRRWRRRGSASASDSCSAPRSASS